MQHPRLELFKQYFDKLHRWKYGFMVLSASISIIVFLLGLAEQQQSLGAVLFESVLYGSILAGIAFQVRKYGWQRFAERTVEVAMKFIGIVNIPFAFVFNLIITMPYKFFIERLHNALPEVLRPLYRLIWYVLGAAFAYYVCWRIFSIDPNPKDFGSINIGYASYPVVITGIEFAGIIMFFCVLDVIPSYFGMFWNWLGKFKWDIRFVFYR